MDARTDQPGGRLRAGLYDDSAHRAANARGTAGRLTDRDRLMALGAPSGVERSRRDVLAVFDRDFLCTTASMFWLTRTIGTSMRLYRDH